MCHAQQPGVKHPIFDPILQRNAFYVTAPANWQFDGVAVPGTLCESLMAMVALLACWYPAHRAMTVDPTAALRED
jgi:ABC-type lipoprotein release transport system permease subunit